MGTQGALPQLARTLGVDQHQASGGDGPRKKARGRLGVEPRRAVIARAPLLAGCIIPGLDTDGRDCPCGADYVCNPTAGKCVHALPLGDASAAVDANAVDASLFDGGGFDAGNLVSIDGEVIELAAGWQVSLYRDFSTGTPYAYLPQDFDDP